MSKIALGFIVTFSALIFFFLIKMGFFKSVDISETTSPQKIVLGRYYKGDPKSEELGNIYLSVGELEPKVNGITCGAFMNDPRNNQGVLEGIIGLVVKDSSYALPAAFKYYLIPERKVIRASMDADQIVLTTKGYHAIFDYCEKNKIPTSEKFFEQFNGAQSYVEMAIGETIIDSTSTTTP